MTPRPSSPEELRTEQLIGAMLDQVDPVPDRALMLAYGASQMSVLKEILAELVYDSALDGDLVATRGDEGEARLLSFANDHLSLEITLFPDRRTVIGELDPLDAAELTELDIESDSGETTTVAVDEFGRFTATAPEAGAFRLRVPGRLVTPWVRPNTPESSPEP